MKSKTSSFVGDLIRVCTSKGTIIVLNFAISIITARYLGPEKNGIIAALLVYPSLFMTIGALGIRQSTAYFLGKNIYGEHDIKKSIIQIWFFTSLFSMIVCFFLMRYFSESGKNIYWVILALVPIPFTLFNTYSSGIFLGKNQIKQFNKINWIPVLTKFIILTVFLVILSWGITGYMIASIGGALVMSTILLVRNNFIKVFSYRFNWQVIKSMISLGVVYAIALLIINLNYKIDVIIMDKLSTPYEVGIYSKGANIIQYLWEIPMVLSTIVFARSATSKNGYAFSIKVAQLLRLSLIIVGGATMLMFVFSKHIILALYGEDFFGSIEILRILAPGVLLLTLFKVMNMDLAGKGKPWVSMKAMIPALILNIILNILWIPSYGAKGASMASTISYSVAAILFIYFYSRTTKIPINKIFRYKKSDFYPLLKLFKKIRNR